MTTRFDAIIIGTGQSGPALAARLAKAGRNVAIVERKLFGGTCVNTGCVPTKTLVASAYAAHLARHAADYGVTIGGPITVDMKRVKARKDEVSGKSRQGVEKWLKGLANCTVIEGHARFESSTTVRVNGEVLEAKQFFINVGGRALVPAMPGLEEVAYLTNSSIMNADYLPEHLIIVGGKNIYPQDIENILNDVPGVHPGRAVAFGVLNEQLGTEDIAVICEVETEDPDEQAAITREIRTRIAQTTDVMAHYVHLVGPMWLLKTSSGKIARTANREKFLKEVLSQNGS